jgi:hypothetical protein
MASSTGFLESLDILGGLLLCLYECVVSDQYEIWQSQTGNSFHAALHVRVGASNQGSNWALENRGWSTIEGNEACPIAHRNYTSLDRIKILGTSIGVFDQNIWKEYFGGQMGKRPVARYHTVLAVTGGRMCPVFEFCTVPLDYFKLSGWVANAGP